MEFANGERLHGEAERRFGRKLSAAEWGVVDNIGWSSQPTKYDESDLADLLSSMREQLAAPVIDRSHRARAQARAYGERIAAGVRSLVERERLGLFGARAAPFAGAAQAAAWIESHAESPQTCIFTVSIELPSQELDLALLYSLRDWLSRSLSVAEASGMDFAAFMVGAAGLRSLNVGTDVLPYLPAVDTSATEIGVKRVYAPPGSRLEMVLGAAQRVASATGWDLVNAVHHLLTGGLMTAPVHARVSYRVTRGGAVEHSVGIEIPYPESVEAATVAAAYTDARRQIPSKRTRARVLPRADRVVAFVLDHPDIRWPKRWETWNQENPRDLFVTSGAMSAAYRRAGKRI